MAGRLKVLGLASSKERAGSGKQLAGRLRHGSAWQIDLGSAPQAGSGRLGLTGLNIGHDPTTFSFSLLSLLQAGPAGQCNPAR